MLSPPNMPTGCGETTSDPGKAIELTIRRHFFMYSSTKSSSLEVCLGYLLLQVAVVASVVSAPD